ncbi:biopolymer transporter ExbD [Marinobacter pelagius]|uniref:ExbD/TolR family protein n=1 Tax=Marinobacter sp. C7 TaxID=2951363 RepID=UPI001EF02697|nr:biopolymer transporter ExbD [Marinobacter sp. C7]MCG7200471.1 biopolymer transporter ExbD [Marinobacter sp. C7]
MTHLVPPPATSGKSLLERVEDALLPLINLVFLLLMFFIVAGQLANEPLPDLPGTAASGQEQAPEADLQVTGTGHWLAGGRILDEDSLLASLPQPGTGQPLRVAADESVTMDELERLFRVLEGGGYKDVLLLTEPDS